MELMIRLESLSKIYRVRQETVRALDDVTLSIGKGEFVGVQGPSGSGKSTLLTMIGGLGRPTSGRVWVADEPVDSMNGRQLSRFRCERIGFVFQMFHLVPYLTVLENVLVPARSSNGARSRGRALQLLERFRLGGRLVHRPDQLSTGEQQRVAIARALINEPDLLLADEPTGNLDSENAAEVLGLLADFHRSGGTVLLVTHEQTAAGFAQRNIHLRNGCIESAENGQKEAV